MGEMVEQIALYANGIMLSGVKYYAFICIFKPAVKKRWIFLSYLVFVIITTQMFFEFESSWAIMGLNIFAFAVLSCLFSGKTSVKIIFAILLYFMGILAEGFSYLILNHIYYARYGVGVAVEYIIPLGRSLASLIHLPLILMMILVFRRFINKNAKHRHFEIPLRYTVAILFMLLGVLLINGLLISATMEEVPRVSNQVTLAHLISFIVIIFVIWIYNTILNNLEEFEKNRQKDQMLERWEIQYQTAINSQKMITELKHNLKFHFLTLSGALRKGDIEQAKAHIEAQIGSFDSVITTGNISIDTMLNYYQQKAKEELDVDIETELFIPSDLKLNVTLTAMILGNALENALDACRSLSHNQRYIHIRAEITAQDEFLLTITNPYATAPVVDSKGNFSTSKADKQNHGFGLASIQEILSEEQGHIHVWYGDNTFRFSLLFYNVL